MYNRTRIIFALTPEEKERGEPPDPDVSGVWNGVRFEKGVSEEVPLSVAGPWAANGRVALSPAEAREYLRSVYGMDEGEEPLPDNVGELVEQAFAEKQEEIEEQVLSEEADAPPRPKEDPMPPAQRLREKALLGEQVTAEELEAVEVPEEHEPPIYQQQLSEMHEAGLKVQDIFGGQPRKEPLLRVYYAWKEGASEPDPDTLIK